MKYKKKTVACDCGRLIKIERKRSLNARELFFMILMYSNCTSFVCIAVLF